MKSWLYILYFLGLSVTIYSENDNDPYKFELWRKRHIKKFRSLSEEKTAKLKQKNSR